MPTILEGILKEAASRKGLSGKRADAYTYGTMNNMGVMHGNKITAKGKKMEDKASKKRGRPKKQPPESFKKSIIG